jgi:hypothetical protein
MDTPDDILERAKNEKPIVIKIEANVVAYFGDLMHQWKEGVRKGITDGPAMTGRRVP